MDDKAAFDKFHLALLYPDERARLGINLNDAESRELLLDRVRAISYYSTWIPDHSAPKKRRQRTPGPYRGRHTIIGWVMFAVVGAVSISVAYYAATGFAGTKPDTLGEAAFGWLVWAHRGIESLLSPVG